VLSDKKTSHWYNHRHSSAGTHVQLHWLPVEWRIKFKIACITYKTISTTQPAYLYSNITPHLVPCVRLTLNCCLFPVSAHVSVLAASLLPLQLFGTPFLSPFVVVSPLTVFGANSKLSSTTLLSGLLNAPPHPAPQIRRVSRRHCALYKFTYLLTYTWHFSSNLKQHRSNNLYEMVYTCGEPN